MTHEKYIITTLKDNPGVFYESIGDLRTFETSWKMITYVDLTGTADATMGLQKELKMVIWQCNNISKICQSQKSLSLAEAKLNKMTQYQNHISELLRKSRIRRAPLEFIGQISKILFGTMTSEDADHIREALKHIENKTDDLATLFINQTVAIRTRFGELHNATLKIRQQMIAMNRRISEKLRNLTNEYMKNEINEYFHQAIINFNEAILEHELNLNILIDGILFGKQGLIHPRIISPQQLIQNSKAIRERVPHEEFPVAINEQGMDQLIKISNLQIAYINARLIYSLHIPLVSPGKYKLYKSVPLPARQDFDKDKYAIIKPDKEYIALNEDSDNYYELEKEDLKRCSVTSASLICPATSPLRKIRQTPSCNIELMLNKKLKPNQCKIILQELQDTYWKVLDAPGNWIFSAKEKEKIRIECATLIEHTTIDNCGIISIQPGCKIKAKTATMSHPSTQITKFLHHYTPSSNLSIFQLYEPTHEKFNINLTEATDEIWPSDHSNIEATFNDIIQKAQQIKRRKIQEWKTTAYSTAACSVGILGIILVIFTLAYRITWISSTTNRLFQGAWLRGRTKEPTPHPATDNINPDVEPPRE